LARITSLAALQVKKEFQHSHPARWRAPRWVKMLVRRAGIDQSGDAIEWRLIYLRWLSDPEAQSGPRRVEVPHFVAPGDGKHV
jgi:hypothetical protein